MIHYKTIQVADLVGCRYHTHTAFIFKLINRIQYSSPEEVWVSTTELWLVVARAELRLRCGEVLRNGISELLSSPSDSLS